MAEPSSRVLIVEDEPIIRDIVTEFLRMDGIEVIQAHGGHSALALFREHSPDLILTDWMMDDGDGEELVREIRRINPSVPIVVVSANSELTFESLQMFGVNLLIPKPFSPDVLVEHVKTLIEELRASSAKSAATSA